MALAAQAMRVSKIGGTLDVDFGTDAEYEFLQRHGQGRYWLLAKPNVQGRGLLCWHEAAGDKFRCLFSSWKKSTVAEREDGMGMAMSHLSAVRPAPRQKKTPAPASAAPARGTVLYFAYGSNMLSSRLEERVGRSMPAPDRAVLHDYKLLFNKAASADGTGRANVVHMEGAEVWGVLYPLKKAELTALDTFEGTASGHYRRVSVEVELDNGEMVTAQTYVAGTKFVRPGLFPPQDYLAIVIEGAKEHGLPAKYVNEIKATAGAKRRRS